MLSRNNHQEQFKKYEPKKQRFTIKKLSVGVASVLLGISFANGVSADTTDANADANTNNGDGSEQTDHNLVLNSANNQTLKEATAANQASGATATSQNPAGDVQTPAANEYEAAVSAAVASQTAQNNTVESAAVSSTSAAVANSANSVATSAASVAQPTSTSAVSQQAASQTAVETSAAPESTVADTQDASTATQTFSSRSFALNDADMARLLGTSLVATNSDTTDIASEKIDFNFKDPSGYNTTVTGIPADKYGYVADYDTSRKITYVLATDRSNPGQTLYLYANGKLVATSSQATTPSKPTLGGKLIIDQTNGNTYQGGTYNYVKTITSSLPGTGLNTFTRIDVTDADGESPVTNGASGSADQSARTLQMIWNNGGKTVESSNWQSIGGLVPTKVKQNVWYVDADTGEVLAHKQSDDTISGQEYNLNGAQYDKITANGKTYDLVKRNNGVYDASQLATDRTLVTNNGVAIKASDLLSTPLVGQLKNYRAGDINFTVTNTGPNRLYVTQQLDTKGTVTLNAYDAERYSDTTWKAMYVSAISRSTLRSGGIADGANSEFVNNATNGNQDVIILYKAATPVANKQNANITFVNDDTGVSLSTQQNASGDAGSQITFNNASTTVANLISQGYVYNGTTGNGVTNGAASGSFTSVGFPVYDNDDNTNQAFVVHFKNPAQTTTYHQGVEESKTIQRTINYYDKVTGARIPSDLIAQNPTTDSVAFTRTQVLDQNGKFVGYGTISSDGKSFRTQDWHTAEGLTTDEFAAKKSADLSAFNYTAPEFQDGKSANVVASHEVTPDTQNLEYNVYYGHQTQQVTTNQDVTRRFHYVFTDGTTPESHLTPQADQKVTFTGTATKDLVTGKTGDTVWTPATGTLAQVAGQQVAGYHITGNVNANADGSANAVTVNPTSGDIDVTIVYTPDAKTPDTPQKAKVTIYDKTENNKQLSTFENNNGTKGSAISFDGEPQTLQAYLNSGYVFDSATDANGNSIGTASNITFGNFDSVDGNVQSFNIYLVHGTDTKTESATTNAHVHYVVAGNEANKPAAPADSPVQTINWTRTNTTDKVTGATTEGTWTPDKNGFTSVTSPTLTNYTPDQAVANFTTPQPNRDQVVTVVYNPNPEVAQKADLVIYDKTDNNKELNSFDNSGKTGTQISFSGSANYVADLIAKGYKIDSFVNDQNQTSNPTSYGQINFSNFDNNSASDQHFKLYLVHDTENVTDKKTTTSTVHYVVSDGKTNPPSDNTQTITWTRPGTKDKVTGVTTPTGNWTTPDSYTDVPTPNLDGYTPDKTNVPAPTPDPNQNPTTVVTYNPKTPDAPTYTGTTETKTVTRTINYYDRVTGEKIPTNLIAGNPTTQNVTLSRTHVVSSTGQDMGYGTVSADGKTFTKAATADGWNTGDWAQVTSPDLSNAGYTTPDLAQADHVTVNSATKDAVVNVYYGHQTEVITPKTPHNPGGNINPNDPRNNPAVYPDGLTKEALTTEVTRHINYVGVNEDGTTTPVNGAPDGKSTYTQTVSFERNAVIDKVTGQILGYSTDGTTNVTTTDKDRAWTPTTQNMDSVASKTPSEVGYDKVDISTVGGVTVYPGQKVNDVTVTYTKNKTPEVTQKATLEIIDNNNANSPKQLAAFSNEGKSEDQINFANSNEILQSYLNQGYKVQKTAGNLSGDAQSGYTYPTYGNTAQDFKIYLIHDTEDKTETATATAQVHYVVADNGVQAPKDSDLQTVTYTRTNTIDKVTGATVKEGTWQADKNAFTDVTSPDLSKDGYTPSLENVQFNAPERNVNQRVTVVYNRSAQAADLQIIDDNDPQNQRVLATYSAGGESGKQISFDGSNTQLQNYLNNGYTFEKSEGQGMSGDAQNGFTYPSFDNDSQSNQSFKIYLKHATGNKTETATTTAHVHYIMADGTKAPDDSATQTINWTRTNTVDQVTGAIVNEGTWSADKSAFTDVDSPAVAGYTPGTKTVKFATPERGINQVVNVVYTKDAPTPDQQNALVIYQDVNDPAHPVDLGQSDQLTGQAGDAINYSTADKIAEYEKQGYVLVSNGFDANGTKPSFDNVNGNTQTFYVTFKHGIQPVTPTTPGTPDQPINPDNPDGPKYPSGTDQTSLTKDVTRTVTYEGAGDQTPSPVTDTLHFQGTGYLDKVTGKWTDANGNELADQAKGITWTITDGTKDEGSFNLVPTKHIDGYTSQVVTDGANDGNGNVKSYTGITHASDNINVVVRYNPIVTEQGNLIVKFHDDTDNKDLTGVGTDTGTQDVGTQVTYNPSTDLTNLENKGYVYVSTDGNIPSSIVKGTTTVTIHVKHGTVPVTPDNPGTPDKPINPNDPDGPKYPSGTDQASIDKTITRTVHYEGADQYTPNDVQQPVHFTAKGVLDKVTGQWTTPLTWSADQTFNGVTTPKIPGYHVVSVDKDTTDNQNVDSAKISHTGADYTVTVKYAKDAAPTPDTTTGKVTYIDDTTGSTLKTDSLSGNVDANIDYTTQDKINSYINMGYKLVSNNFTDGKEVFNKDASKNNFEVHLVHDTVPVTPENPGTPDQPINPNDPRPQNEQPKYPNGTSETDLTKDITRTVHYAGAGEYTPNDVQQPVHFTAKGVLDKVTGEWITPLTWSADQTFNSVTTPKIPGYHVVSVDRDANGNDVASTTIAHTGSDYTVNVVYAKDDVPAPKTQQNAQLIIRDVTPGQEQDLGSYTQPGLEGDAISFGSAQEFVQNLLNKGYVWDGASYNGANLDATNYAGINFGNYDNTDDKNGISQKWVINLVHGVTPVNPDHPDDKNGYTKEYLDRTITRDVTYVDEQGNAMPGLTPEHQEAKFQGSGYLDNVTGKWVNVENGKITGLADGLTWTPDTDANFDAIAAKTADGYHVISVSGNGISGFTVDANGAVTAQTVNHNTASSTIKVVYAKTPEVPVPANGSIVYIDDTTGNQLENATFGGNVGQKINYTTADRIANYEGRGYKLVSNNFKDGNESFTNGENKFEVHLTHDTTTKDVTKTVTRDVTYVYEDGSQADTPVNQSFTFNGKTVTDRVTGAEKTSWDTNDHNFDATKSIDTTNYRIVGISKTNTTANVDNTNGVVASETITPTSQNSSVVITLAKKVTPPTPVKQGTIEVIYHDTTDNVDIPGYGQPQTKEDQGTAFSYNPNAKDLPALENKGYVLDGELPTIPTEYTDGNQRVVINVKHGTRPVTPENPANPTDPVDPQHPQTPTPSNPNLSKTDLEKTITRTVQYQYADGTKAHADVVQTVNFTGEGTIDLVTGNLVTVDKDGNILNQRGKITWNHDSQDFANVAAINHDGYYVSNVSENGTTAKVDGTAVASETVTPTSQNSTIVITLTKSPETPVVAQGSIVYIDDTTGNQLEKATFGGNVGDKINYTTADRIAYYTNKGYDLVSNNFNDGNETFAKDGNVFEVHLVHATTPITPENPGKPGQEVPNPNDPEHPHKIPANFVPQTLTNTVTRDVTYVYEDGSQAEAPVHQTFTFTGNGVVDLVTGQLVTVENGKITGAGHITWNAENHDFDATKAIDTIQYNIVKVSENNTTAKVDMNNGVVAGETITPTSQNSSVVITLAKKPVTPTPVQKGTVIVNYVDKTTGKTLETATSTGNEGSNVDYSTKDTITKYTNQGYKLEHDGYPTGTVTYTNGTVTYEVDLVHDTVPVNPDQPGPKTPNTPINPDNPDGPKYPDGTQPEQLTKTITRTINYVGDGLNIPSVEKSLTFVANGVLDKVTGQWVTVDKDGKITGNANGMTWTIKDGDADEGSFDEVAGPQTDGYHITNIAASNEDLSDINSSTGTVAGKTINHTNGNIVITINYAKNPITPTPTPADQTVVGKQIVHYVDGDNNNAKLLDDNTNDTFVFTKSGKTGTWNADSHKYANANAPVIDGYVAEQKTYEGQTATPGDADKEITIVYHKIGKIIPVDPSGNPIPNAPTPSYHNDPTDPTKVTPNEPTPTVPGWTTNVPNVTPDTPTGDTKVPYTKPTPTQDKGSITITVHDVTDNTDLPEYGKTSGSQNVGTEFNYDKTGTFTSLTNKGYKIVNPDVTIPTGITKGDQNIVIYVEHTTTPITPENPGKPGQPINPNDPTGPQYPDGSDQVTKNVTRTITYVDNNGNKLHDSVEQTAHFTGTGVIDNVTGKWVTPITWNGNGDLSGQNTPVIDGYHVTNVSRDGDGNNVAKVTVNHGDSDYTVVVTYTPNGKIVPVDPSGNPIPDVPTPQYPTDPSDPAKVTPDEPVPSIPGFTPEVPTVTPTNPGEDTPVVYTPDTPVTPVTVQGKVTYVDDTTGQTISTDNFSGKVGDKITYTTADKISELEGQGYKLVSNNFKDGNETFTNGENSFVIHLKHAETIVTPENPHDSGEESYTTQKTTTFTVHYVGAGDKTPSDRVETIQWHRQVTVDSVTGNVISTTPWTTDGSYTGANTPVIDGFHADKAVVNAPQADPDKDVVETVTYAPNGHIIPVDKNGTPIPGADQPVYPTDPTDPTKVVPNEPVPTVPGYTPERETVTPVDPGTDTPVVYDRGNTPVTPETPTTTPTTPGDDTPSNETPVTPETPVDNGSQEGNNEVIPTPQTPESPADNGSVNPAAPQPTAVKQTNAQQPAATTKAEAKKLPQTGNADANSAEILGLAALGLTGLVGLGKKRRKED
ncbi:YSIRK-type signal peptide-containing protein [Limosilactobacillus reuteri]|uniref:mucin-binding protein n=1 Tax=Limosilactobacillus reuteri TaxID=1598 RepID=UPI00254CA8BB|nr:YSIRK-type signal peptide-containing protein [Limosilactobacillus reuteri]MDK8117022.1 YSIRK-type signal peptide-containing protein [Limosilactobacillus reuteri]